MNSKGRYYNNAAYENLFHTLKFKLTDDEDYQN